MNSTEQPTPDGAAPSSLLPMARVFAIVLAVSIVSLLVWDAQQSAQPERVPEQGPVEGDAGKAAVAQQPEKGPSVDDVLMSSSKSDVLMPSSKFAPVDFFSSGEEKGVVETGEVKSPLKQPLLYGSKSGLLPSSKVIVLPSSKSGRPLQADDPEVMKLLESIRKKQAEEAGKEAGEKKADAKNGRAPTQSGSAPK